MSSADSDDLQSTLQLLQWSGYLSGMVTYGFHYWLILQNKAAVMTAVIYDYGECLTCAWSLN